MEPEISFDNFDKHRVATNETLDGIAKANGMTWQQLANFNWGISDPDSINECLHDLVGCLQKTKDRKNYRFTSKDDPGIIYVPVKSSVYNLKTTASHTIRVTRPHLTSDVEVETVDDFRNPVGNVALVLHRKEGGPDVEIMTDDHGYVKAAGILTGHYKVQVEGKRPAYFLSKTFQPDNKNPDADLGHFEEAVIDTLHRIKAITQIVVERTATKGEKQERRLLQREYTRKKDLAIKGRGSETASDPKRIYDRTRATVAFDNLALIAGWAGDEVDIARLVNHVLPDFLQDYGATAKARGYYVWVVEPYGKPPRISLYDSSGAKELSFNLARPLHPSFGTYATFEENGGRLFVDVLSKSGTIVVDGYEKKELPIDMLVGEGDRTSFNDATVEHERQGHVPIVYVLPTAKQLESIGFHGGSGRLEDYGRQEGTNGHIHSRNHAVCAAIGSLYNRYVEGYVQKVKDTLNEKALRALGPPWSLYIMPAPARATTRQLIDIYSSYNADLIRPWRHIAEQLDYFAGDRVSEGLPFISIKAKWEIAAESESLKNFAFATGLIGTSSNEPIPTALEVEGSLTFQFSEEEVRTIFGGDVKTKAELSTEFKSKDGKTKIGLEFKRKVKNREWEVTIHTGPLELEAGQEGNRKIAIEVFPDIWSEAEFNPRSAKFEGGLKIQSKLIIKHLAKLPIKSHAFQEFIDKYGEKVVPEEISIHAGFVGLTQRTALAAIAPIPGFFEVRDPDILVRLKWNLLSADEQQHLAILDWNPCTWDLKSYADAKLPKSMEEEWEEYSPKQQIATLYLGFYDAANYQKRVNAARTNETGWEEVMKERHCAPEQKEEEAQTE